jgi:hypothetical protein
VWCGSCYLPHADDRFHRFVPRDEGGFEWKSTKEPLRYHVGRDGNHLVTVFQCDDCVFLNLLQRRPLPHSPRDNLTLCCIRRLNLDALWGKETSTVNSTTRAVRQTVNLLQPLGIQPQYPALGPFPLEDTLGYGVAVAMLLKSLEPGRYDTYQQFATIRKLRAGYHNVYMSSSLGANSLRSVGGDNAKHFLNTCPTHSGWFEMFSLGCLRRMGQEVRQDRAVSLPVMHALMAQFSQEWDATPPENANQRLWLASLASYCVICYCGSFRGPECFLVDLYGLRKYLNTPRHASELAHVVIPLLGKVKNEHGERYHLTPLCSSSKSGLQVELWVRRLVSSHDAFQHFQGPAFRTKSGAPASSSDYELDILDRLHLIQQHSPELIPADVQVYEEYGLSRSFRRGSTSEARSRNVSEADINLTNRWRTFDKAKGRYPRLSMQDHYSDIRLLVPALLRFSSAL